MSTHILFRAKQQVLRDTDDIMKAGYYSIDVVQATGGTVTESGGYRIHKFTADGTLTVSSGGAVEYLVVGGGGGGGGYLGGGGGGGGFRTGAATLTPGGYGITVGNGGLGVLNDTGQNGGNSIFNGVTAAGGGGGGKAYGIAGSNGGSGGGGGGSNGGGGTGGTGNTPVTTPAQGFNGGSAVAATTNYGAGGGGGAGGVGQSATGTSAGGSGGDGAISSITGTTVTYAGGGGGSSYYSSGGAAGSGGGGIGASGDGFSPPRAPGNGTANTGGGGGGGAVSYNTGGNGGSGVVIIRYQYPPSLHIVDADLTAANIKSGIDIFGFTGTFTSDANATAGDILAPQTAYVNGVKLTGTIPVRTLSADNDTVNAGYYAATTLHEVDTDLLTASNIKEGVEIFGFTGTFNTSDATATAGDILASQTAYVNDVKLTGTMPTRTLSAANDTVNAGYYAATTLSAVDADLTAANIAVSTTIFGFTGTFTSDADATAGDIMASSTAYVNGVKLTGTIAKRTLKNSIRIYLTTTGAGTWTVPDDWNSANNTIEVIGGGGYGGAAYSKSVNVTLTTGNSVSYYVGTGGSGGTSGEGVGTWFCNSTSNCASLGDTAVVVGAENGHGWAGGAAANGKCTGTGCLRYSGGSRDFTYYGYGGAGGPYGAGQNGSLSNANGGAGGNGSGGAGGTSGSMNGGNGMEWDTTHGSGGGAYFPGYVGPVGGLYGGGGSTGAQGIIVITYGLDAVNAGYYAATTLHAVDANLAAGNIAVSTTIFGFTGTFTSDANATASDIRASSTAYVNGVKLTGTIPTQTLSAANDTVDAGYYAATTLHAVDADLTAANIAVSTNIFGFTGTFTSDANATAGNIMVSKTAYVNGVKLTGTMPTQTLSADNDTMNAGYYAATTLHDVDADLAPGNIRIGVDLFGVSGTASVAVPDTSQTTSYVPMGDDAMYNQPSAQKSYADNGDGTITDNRTGLTWKKCSEPDTTTDCSGSPTTYTWANAITQCEGLSYASQTDWRLPNAIELFTLVLQEGSAPLINTTYFPATVSGSYWTATTRVTNTANALRVAFDLGTVNKDSAKTSTNYVRCVK